MCSLTHARAHTHTDAPAGTRARVRPRAPVRAHTRLGSRSHTLARTRARSLYRSHTHTRVLARARMLNIRLCVNDLLPSGAVALQSSIVQPLQRRALNVVCDWRTHVPSAASIPAAKRPPLVPKDEYRWLQSCDTSATVVYRTDNLRTNSSTRHNLISKPVNPKHVGTPVADGVSFLHLELGVLLL